MSSALINRMFHVQLKVDVKQWLEWAYLNNLHPWVTDYISQKPTHLFSEPPKTEEPYSTPRSWHMLSDALKQYNMDDDNINEDVLRFITYGCITSSHAGMFIAYTKQTANKYLLSSIIKGEAKLPADPKDRDVLYYLSQSFRSRLLKELPSDKNKINKDAQFLAHRAKSIIKELASINFELAQMVVSSEEDEVLPQWFMIELIRDIPRLAISE